MVRGIHATATEKEDRKQRQERSWIASNGKREARFQATAREKEDSKEQQGNIFHPLLQTGMYGFERAPKRRIAEAQETVEEDPEVVAEQGLKIRWST